MYQYYKQTNKWPQQTWICIGPKKSNPWFAQLPKPCVCWESHSIAVERAARANCYDGGGQKSEGKRLQQSLPPNTQHPQPFTKTIPDWLYPIEIPSTSAPKSWGPRPQTWITPWDPKSLHTWDQIQYWGTWGPSYKTEVVPLCPIEYMSIAVTQQGPAGVLYVLTPQRGTATCNHEASGISLPELLAAFDRGTCATVTRQTLPHHAWRHGFGLYGSLKKNVYSTCGPVRGIITEPPLTLDDCATPCPLTQDKCSVFNRVM